MNTRRASPSSSRPASGFRPAHKRNLSAAVEPLLITALLVFAFHPRWCKTLQVFPWFAYNRVAGRGTVVLPTSSALIGVSVDAWPRLAKRVVGAFAVAEFLTAVFLVNEFRPARLEARHMRYFETVARTPGAALLEWPFCIASANSVITRELCPYYERIATAYANRRFHQKATVSIYLSRVHKTQFKSWLHDGWEDMFMPDDPSREHPSESSAVSPRSNGRASTTSTGRTTSRASSSTPTSSRSNALAFPRALWRSDGGETLPRLGRVEFIPRSR